MNSKQTCLLLLLGLTAAATPDQFFAYDNIEHQSGGDFKPNPMGFWSDANGTYAANLELPDRSRWVKVGNSAAGNLKTSEASPQLSPLRVLGVNASGECCGWTKTVDAVNGPCKWSAGSLASNITANPILAFNSQRKAGEALMINNQGWAVGYFASSQSFDAVQDPFVAPLLDEVLLDIPAGFSQGRATCINGKTNTPATYRIGGWKRSDGGVVHAMLWKKVGSDWQIETINDPDHVLDDRITWIADINDNGVCVGRIENSNSVPQGNEYIDATEQGGLFLYDPSDKVRRINLTGLEFAVPARINNNKEILVNRVENYVPLVSFVIPPDPNNAAIRGCNVSVRNLVVPAEYVPTTVYDFRDDRRWTGAASIGANSYGHISKVSTTVTHPTFTSVIVTGLTYVNGTSESGMYSLDGQAAEFQFTGTGEHSIEVRVQDSGAMSGYQLYGIVRAMTTGAYKVNTKLWRWQFGSFDNETGDQVFGSDSFTSDIGTNNGLDFIHNWGGGDKEYRAKMVFTPPTFSSGTPTVQVERIAFARVS